MTGDRVTVTPAAALAAPRLALDASAHLRRVERAAAKAAGSRSALEAAMREAQEYGASLRAIAAAAGVSHEQVRRLLRS